MGSAGGTLTIYADAAGTTPANPQDVYNAFMSGLVLLATVGSDVSTYTAGGGTPAGASVVAVGMQYYGTPTAVTAIALLDAQGTQYTATAGANA